MMRGPWKGSLVCLALFGLFQGTAPAQSWSLRHRLQLGVERDSNALESRDAPVAADALRWTYDGRVHGRSRGVELGARFSGAAQIYPDLAQENKWTGNFDLTARAALGRGVSLTGYYDGYLKLFFNDDFDFADLSAGILLRKELPAGWHAALGWHNGRLDYQHFDSFDFVLQGADFLLRRRIDRRTGFGFTIQRNWLRFSRPATELSPAELVLFSRKRQRDRQWLLRAQLTAQRRALWQFSVEWLRNTSNSFGYGQDRLRASLHAACPLHRRWLLRLAFLVQAIRYHEKIPPVYPIELDVERNESNYVIADMVYTLRPESRLLFRTAWYNNEGALRGLFYRKFLLFLGAEQSF